MANKTKKNIKVRDLKPSKDAKGGGPTRSGQGLNSAGNNSSSLNSRGIEGSTTNHKHHLGGHGGGHH